MRRDAERAKERTEDKVKRVNRWAAILNSSNRQQVVERQILSLTNGSSRMCELT